MKIYDYPSPPADTRLEKICGRTLEAKKKDLAAVLKIINSVRKNGDAAVVDYTRQFDAPRFSIDRIQVTPAEIKAADRQVDGKFRRALKRAADQIADFHRSQVSNSYLKTERQGTVLGQLVRPVDAAGVYVPGGKGGKTPLVSSVLMGAIPAKIAGVGKVVMMTPPTGKGGVNPHLLVAAKTAGVDAIYKVGGPWAIAAMAYGTESIPKVDVIVGPGNLYVTLAKKILSGTVGIDMIAGPSEILVIADADARADAIAADLLSQAEHDPMASAILVTPSGALAKQVLESLELQLKDLPRQDIARKSLASYGAVFKVPKLDTAFQLANRIAPEHLELQIREPFDSLDQIRHAGAVFLGSYTPEPVGDYIAGPNHVLPTAGTARFASALSVDNFIKKTSIIHYSEAAFRKEAPAIMCLARTEGLEAHARSVEIRLSSLAKKARR